MVISAAAAAATCSGSKPAAAPAVLASRESSFSRAHTSSPCAEGGYRFVPVMGEDGRNGGSPKGAVKNVNT